MTSSTQQPDGMARWAGLAGRMDGMEHILPVRVYYEDTDAGGVVYHANYLRYCERARTDFLRLLGIRHGELRDEQGRPLHFLVRRMNCDFLRPARLNDVLEVRTRLVRGSRVRMVAWQEVHVAQRDGETGGPPQTGPIFTAEVTVAVIDDSGRPARLPKAAMEMLARLTDGGGAAAGQS